METSQNKQIITALNKGFILSPLMAFRLFKCMRLSARILELKKQGHNIKSRLHHEKELKFKIISPEELKATRNSAYDYLIP